MDSERLAAKREGLAIEYSIEWLCCVLVKLFAMNVKSGFYPAVECDTESRYSHRAARRGWIAHRRSRTGYEVDS